MIRMLSAELLKLRRRWASYIVLIVLVGLMTLIYLLVGTLGRPGGSATTTVLRFPSAYTAINQFVFGLGSLLAVCYAAAIGGADWNWGIVRVVVARGESRSLYIVVKAVAIMIAVFIGVVIAYFAGILLTFIAAALVGAQTGNPFAGSSLDALFRAIGYGSVVIIERAMLGFSVAVLLRSQLAGIVSGIVLYIGETILTGLLIALTFRANQGLESISGQQWYQFLPFSIGNSVLSGGGNPNDIGSALLQPVPLATALIVTVAYMLAAIVIAALSVERAEISS